MRTRVPLWIYVATAAAIASAAFALGQVIPGLGAVFAAGATTLWTGLIVAHERKRRSEDS